MNSDPELTLFHALAEKTKQLPVILVIQATKALGFITCTSETKGKFQTVQAVERRMPKQETFPSVNLTMFIATDRLVFYMTQLAAS